MSPSDAEGMKQIRDIIKGLDDFGVAFTQNSKDKLGMERFNKDYDFLTETLMPKVAELFDELEVPRYLGIIFAVSFALVELKGVEDALLDAMFKQEESGNIDNG